MYLEAVLPPPAWFSAIEHGRKHTGTDQQRMAEWQRLKSQGVKTGISDMLIIYLGQLIGVELKAGKNGTNDDQERFGVMMEANGFRWRVIRSVVDLHDYLVGCGVPIARSMKVAAMHHDAALSVPEPVKKASAPKDRAEKPQAATLRKMAAMRARTMC